MFMQIYKFLSILVK